MITKAALIGGLVLLSTPSLAEELKPTPCDVRKIMKVTKGEDGKEILTSTITADCGYDSNFVKKYNQLKQEIRTELSLLDRRMTSQENKPPSVIIKEIRPIKAVDLKPRQRDDNMIEWSWIEFFIGMLEGLQKEKS